MRRQFQGKLSHSTLHPPGNPRIPSPDDESTSEDNDQWTGGNRYTRGRAEIPFEAPNFIYPRRLPRTFAEPPGRRNDTSNNSSHSAAAASSAATTRTVAHPSVTIDQQKRVEEEQRHAASTPQPAFFDSGWIRFGILPIMINKEKGIGVSVGLPQVTPYMRPLPHVLTRMHVGNTAGNVGFRVSPTYMHDGTLAYNVATEIGEGVFLLPQESGDYQLVTNNGTQLAEANVVFKPHLETALAREAARLVVVNMQNNWFKDEYNVWCDQMKKYRMNQKLWEYRLYHEEWTVRNNRAIFPPGTTIEHVVAAQTHLAKAIRDEDKPRKIKALFVGRRQAKLVRSFDPDGNVAFENIVDLNGPQPIDTKTMLDLILQGKDPRILEDSEEVNHGVLGQLYRAMVGISNLP